jgi:hypothetical protein
MVPGFQILDEVVMGAAWSEAGGDGRQAGSGVQWDMFFEVGGCPGWLNEQSRHVTPCTARKFDAWPSGDASALLQV